MFSFYLREDHPARSACDAWLNWPRRYHMAVGGAIAVIIGACFLANAQAREHRVRDTAGAIAQAIPRVEQQFPAEHHFAGLDQDRAIEGGAFPSVLVAVDPAGSRYLQSPWGGDIRLVPAAGNGWALVFDTIPSRTCPQLIQSMAGMFSMVAVNNTMVKASTDRPVDMVAAERLCEQREFLNLAFGRGSIGLNDVGRAAPTPMVAGATVMNTDTSVFQ